LLASTKVLSHPLAVYSWKGKEIVHTVVRKVETWLRILVRAMEQEENERQSLMRKLLDSVKQCQVNFGGKTILATEKDSSVSCLLHHFEVAFQHGLKKNKMIEMISSISEPFRQVTQKMLPEYESNFWAFLKSHMLPLDIQLYQNMEGIVTDTGRARVWLRTAFNENSLERNLNAFFADKDILRQHYETWALFLDEERSSTLPIMARGLGSILFACNTKDGDLNKPFKIQNDVPVATKHLKTHRRVNSSPLPIMAMAGFDTEPTIMKKINIKKKKKKKVIATISNLDDEIYEHEKLSLSKSLSNDIIYNNEKKYTKNNLSSNQSNSVESARYDNSTDNSRHNSITEENNVLPESPMYSIEHTNITETYSQSLSSRLQTLNKTNINTTIPPSDTTSAKTLQQKLLENTSSSADNKIDNKTLFKEEGSAIEDKSVLSSDKIIDSSNRKTLEQKNNHIVDPYKSNTGSAEYTSKADTSITSIGSVEYTSKFSTEGTTMALKPDVNTDRYSSSSDITVDDFDGPVLTVGSANTNHMQILMSYDEESHQAANDTMALLTSVSSQSDVFAVHNIVEQKEASTSHEMDKYIQSSSHQVSENLSTVDLKQAILATVKKKDEVEQRNKVLHQALQEQRELNNTLQNEMSTLQNESLHKVSIHKKKTQDMTKEIDVLKNQLKKYVAAVQMLRNDKILTDEAKEAIGNLRSPVEDLSIPPKPKERTLSENDSIFEDKLAQMAEMHGELLELQNVLQKQLVSRDHEITRMKQDLVSLRGPLPESLKDSIDNPSLCNSSESLYVVHPTLINIWIPSVFLKGKGTDAHHLYQVYVRIGDEEWNIYRRYSQFNKLHLQVSKMYPVLEKLDFPKKKMFGKKDIKFVEQRRRKLQEYLRCLINTCISSNTELSTHTSKSDLTSLIPFFGDQYGGDEDKKQKKKNDKKTKSSPQYTGL